MRWVACVLALAWCSGGTAIDAARALDDGATYATPGDAGISEAAQPGLESGADQDAGPRDATDVEAEACFPLACTLAQNCGMISNGCGGMISCGGCAQGWICVGHQCTPGMASDASYCGSGYGRAYDRAIEAGSPAFCSQTGICSTGECCDPGFDGPLCLPL